MSVISNNQLAGASGQGGSSYEIERSLRFNSADSAYLNRTPSSAGNQKKFTWSGWIKRTEFGGNKTFFSSANSGTSNPRTDWEFFDDTLYIGFNPSGSSWLEVRTSRVFRDPSAWYHIVIAVDTSESTNTDRVKIYVNGERETNFQSYSTIPQYSDLHINSANQHAIGRYEAGDSNYFPGYLADVHFIDGQALAASDFGEYDDNNVWQAIKYSGSYSQPASGSTTSLSQTGWQSSDQANIWDGDTSTRAIGYNGGTVGNVTFNPPLTGVTKVEVYVQDYNHFLNGSSITTSQSGTGWHTYYDNSGSPITLTSVGSAYSNNQQTVDFYAIRINDTIVDAQTWTPPSGVGLGGTGLNSFHLPFSDNSSDAALGTDSSGNSNTWTVNNISAIDAVGSIYAEFSGSSNQYLRNNSGNVLPGSNGAFTIECHFYPHTTNVIGLFDGGSGSTSIMRNYGNNTIEKQGGGSVSFAGNYTQNAWNHIAIVYTGSTSTDTLTVYVNGVSSGSSSGLNGFTPGSTFDIGTINGGGDGRFDGYIRNFRVTHAAVYSSNFTAPSHSNNLPAITNTKLLVLTTPANGLTGAGSGTTLGMSNNGSVSSGTLTPASETDSFIDTPTNYEATSSGNNGGNYCTLNPLTKSSSASTLTNGNLDFDVTAGSVWSTALATMAFTTEKIYFETTSIRTNGLTGCNASGGILAVRRLADQANWSSTANDNYSLRLTDVGCVRNGTVSQTQLSSGNLAAGDVTGFAIDGANGTYKIYRNGTLESSGSLSLTGYSAGDALIPFVAGFPDGGGYTYGKFSKFNFGQKPFAYTPPTGHKSLCTTNFADPTIADGSTAMDVKLYTGNGSTQSITGLNFSPDAVWIKARANTWDHALFDIVRGAGKRIRTNQTTAEGADSTTLTSFDSNGFTTGSDDVTNENGYGYVAWTWDAGTVGTNEVGDYWSPPTYQTKYIGFKFPTSSGGRAVFGLIAGTGTADIYTSSDNSSWTRVQSNVTLSTTDTTYDSTSQYLLVVNTTNAVWANRHYAMATSGTDAHYSTSVYPGSGASFTWSGPAYSDWAFRSSGTVIRPSSLNSSVYDQSVVWSSQGTATNWQTNYPFTRIFNGNDYGSWDQAAAGNSASWTHTINNVSSFKIRVYVPNRTYHTAANDVKINGSDIVQAHVITPNLAEGWHTLDIGNIGTFTSLEVDDSYWYVQAIYINGKQLVDSNVTPPVNVPALATTVRANASAGFSIVSFTGNGSGTATIGHGLNATPELIILKDRDNAYDWLVYTQQIDGSWDYLKLNKTDAKSDSSYSAATSSVFSYATDAADYIAYCFAPVEGYSAFGLYTANGSANGPFVYTGFRPRFLMLKSTSSGDWFIVDTERDPFNGVEDHVYPNNPAQEATGTPFMDILSNGFKYRYAGGGLNTSGHTIIYAAFAEHPFKTARAR